jgi:hypothetical protein
MKQINVSVDELSLEELFSLAEGENLLLKLPNGEEFIFAEMETEAEFEREVEALSQNVEFRKFLAERSKDPNRRLLADVIKEYEAEDDD